MKIKRHKIADDGEVFEPGTVLQLDPHQAGSRMQSLNFIKGGLFEVVVSVSFTKGETIGIADPDGGEKAAGKKAEKKPDGA